MARSTPHALTASMAGLAAVAVLGVGVASAAGSSPLRLSGSATPTPASAQSEGEHTAPAAQPPANAVQLRSLLQMLFGEHVMVAVDLMRERQRGTTERTQAALAAVQSNTDDLAQAVGQLYGDDVRAKFEALWSTHVRQLSDYAGALQANDTAAAERARAGLVQTERDLGALLSTALGGRMSPGDLDAVVTMHVNMLLDQADAFAKGDYAEAYRLERAAFAHMLETADALAVGIATARGLPLADIRSPKRELQSGLSRILAEHMALLTQALRARAENSPEFPAAGAALNANTADLVKAVRALYGDEAAQRLMDLWAQHVEALVRYAEKVAQDQPTDAEEAALDAYVADLSAFLATATEQRLPAIELSAALSTHDEDLTQFVQAWAAGQYEEAGQQAQEGYRHMFALAETLALAIGDAVASGLPQGGAATGGGGMAGAATGGGGVAGAAVGSAGR